MNFNCSIFLDLRNLQEHIKKAFCYQKLFFPFTIWINCSSDLKNFANSRPSASDFKSLSRSLEHFFLTVGLNNFVNKIPLPFTFQGILMFCSSMEDHNLTTISQNTMAGLLYFLSKMCQIGPLCFEKWSVRFGVDATILKI